MSEGERQQVAQARKVSPAGMFRIRVHGRADLPGEAEAKAEEKAEEEEDKLFEGLAGGEPAEAASFMTGNPQVRVTTGKLRFYRPDNLPYAAGASSTGGRTNQQLPIVRNTLVCIVSVPAHMPPVEILEFLAGFLVDISLVRILKDPERGNCMTLMQFTTQDRADQFFLVSSWLLPLLSVGGLTLTDIAETCRRSTTASTSTRSSRSAARSYLSAASSSTRWLSTISLRKGPWKVVNAPLATAKSRRRRHSTRTAKLANYSLHRHQE